MLTSIELRAAPKREQIEEEAGSHRGLCEGAYSQSNPFPTLDVCVGELNLIC